MKTALLLVDKQQQQQQQKGYFLCIFFCSLKWVIICWTNSNVIGFGR